MINLGSLLTTFEVTNISGGSWGRSKNWLEPNTQPSLSESLTNMFYFHLYVWTRVATRVFNVRLLHAFAFSKKLPWLTLANVICKTYFENAAACSKRILKTRVVPNLKWGDGYEVKLNTLEERWNQNSKHFLNFQHTAHGSFHWKNELEPISPVFFPSLYLLEIVLLIWFEYLRFRIEICI